MFYLQEVSETVVYWLMFKNPLSRERKKVPLVSATLYGVNAPIIADVRPPVTLPISELGREAHNVLWAGVSQW